MGGPDAQGDALACEFIGDVASIAKWPGEPVKLGDHEGVPFAHGRHRGRSMGDSCAPRAHGEGPAYGLSLSLRREWIMLCRILNASDCSSSVMPPSILTSTDRTATVAFARLRRPRGVSRVGRTFPTGACRRPGHVAVSFQGLKQHVHRLPCHECSSRELGVRQARALCQQLEAGVVGHGHPERPQHCLHGSAKGARRLFQQVAQ